MESSHEIWWDEPISYSISQTKQKYEEREDNRPSI